jgi:hypothetical protein
MFYHRSVFNRLAARWFDAYTLRDNQLGFRVALSAP